MYYKLLMLKLQPALSANDKGGDLGCMDCRGRQLETPIHEISKLEFHTINYKKGFYVELKRLRYIRFR